MAERSNPWRPYDPDSERGSEAAQPAPPETPREEDRPRAADETRGEEDRPPAAAETQREEPRKEARQRGEGDRERSADDRERSSDEDRPAEDQEPTTVDAMGQDKHREVIGQRYGASRGRQFLYYGIFVAVIVFGYIGLKVAVSELDKAPAKDRDQAPWSRPDAPQSPLGGFEPRESNPRGPADFQ